jgi:predicted ATP-dependent protease
MRDWTAAFTLSLLLYTTWSTGDSAAAPREQQIPILGITTGTQPIGTVTYIIAAFEERADRNGLSIRFHERPGRFSPMAKTAAEKAIKQAAGSLGLSTDSWSVELKVPYEGVTVSGDSLSAMVGVTIAAMAQGKPVPTGHVLTGTVTDEGEIGPVGSVPLKVQAARAAKLRRVFVPEGQVPEKGTTQIPARLEISPVRSVPEALEALTGQQNVR